MSAGFTHGPWHVAPDANSYSPPSVVVAGPDDYVIAEVFGDEAREGDDEAEVASAAHLIAAAPELYAALDELVATSYSSPEWERVCSEAARALAKARGEQ